MDAVSLPRPAWMTEDLVLLEEQAQRFIAAEYVPHLDRWAE
jgi:acyl-CoA dehydrogenase